MQTTGHRADFTAGTALSGSSTADWSDINDPFNVCGALMRERNALIYHRLMLKRKRTEMKQALQKQRRENELCPALFVFPSSEALLMETQSDRVCATFSTYGIAHQCVHNSAVLSSSSTPIGSGVRDTGLTEYQKPFHAHSLMRTLRHAENFYLCSAHQDAVMHALNTAHTAPMLRSLELDLPQLNEDMVQSIFQLERARQLEYVAIRLHRVTPILKLLCSLASLRSIDLRHSNVTNEELRGIEGCHSLVKLDLSFCRRVSDLSCILVIQTLEVVKLSGCHQLRAVGALGCLPSLKELDLCLTAVTDEEIRQLSESHTLVKINIHSCYKVTNVNPLSSIATLEVVNLSFCTSLTHLGALGTLPALKELNLCETPITDDDVRQLSESHTLVKINLTNCRLLTNVNPLSSIPTLAVIHLSGCTSLTHLGALSKLPALKEVDLSGTPITDEDVRLLSECQKLLIIGLYSCKALTNVNPLSSIATLKEIVLSGCTSLTHVGALGKLPVLREVDLSCTPITDDEVNSLKSLREQLSLPRINIIRDPKVENSVGGECSIQ